MSRAKFFAIVILCASLALVVAPIAGADPPTVSITGGPSAVTNSTTASFTFAVTTDDPDAAVECSVDSGGFSGCGSGVSYSVGEGSHSFVVRVSTIDGPAQDSTSWTVDTTGPSFSLPSSPLVKEADEASGASVSYSASASDPRGVASFSCTPASGSTFPDGTTTVNCVATDNVGNNSSGSFQVLVHDTTPPTITAPASLNDTSLNGVNSKVETYTVTFSGGTGSCSPASGATFPLGSTTVTCNAQDSSGNSSPPKSFSVNLSDTTPPTVNVPGTQTASSPLGNPVNVTYSGVSATDGPRTLTPSCVPASGSSFALGTTQVSCSATDFGNNTTTRNFNVVVQDTTAPTVSISGGPSGTVGSGDASFSFSANEGSTSCSIDAGGFSPCSSPASYSGLGDGSHTFQVRATDAANNTGTASRGWTVDLSPPTFSAPSAMTVEANGPDGAVVTYSVTAADNGVPLLPAAVNCSPASATKFPIGTTTVTCSASDSFGNSGTASFSVEVRDSTPPRIIAADITVTATTAAGIRKIERPISTYLEALRASDLVSNVVPVIADSPEIFPVGDTALRLRATDRAGNSARRTITVTVLPVGREAPPPPDLSPPADVSELTATPSDHAVALSWTPPVAKDLASIEVRMTESSGTAVERVVSRGIRSSTNVVGLKNGTEYRFLVISIDRSGNESRGAVILAVPEARLLVSPKAGTRVTAPPLLRWAPAPGASYYNVQLFKGKLKVLSAWPTRAQMKLTKTWTYANTKRQLSLGTYTWYVWPGFGARADVKYGKLRGKSSFVVVKATNPA